MSVKSVCYEKIWLSSKKLKLDLKCSPVQKRRFSGNCLSKRQAGRILVKSIDIGVHEIGIVEEYWSSLHEFNNVYLDGLPHPSWSTATVAGAIV